MATRISRRPNAFDPLLQQVGKNYPDPPSAQPSSAPVPAPQPPKVQTGSASAAPTTQTAPAGQGWNASNSGPSTVTPPATGPVPSPYAATGTKGAPIPGQTVSAAGVTGAPASPTAAPTPSSASSGPFGDDTSYLNHVKNTIDSTISDAQWMAWKPDLDSGCPSNKPFKTSRPGPGGSFNGPERCVEKPDNCPDGYRVIGNDQSGTARCLPEGSSEFGGGAPGGGGGYPGSPGGGSTNLLRPSDGSGGTGYQTPGTGGFGGIDAQLQQIISGNLAGQNSRYTPEAIAALLSGTKATAEDQSQMARDQISEDAAARGVLGAGATGTALANARIAANRTVAGEQGNIARAKIDADYQDKQQAIQNAQTYLEQARDWAYKQQMTALQRQQFDANLTLAYARLQQEWDQMQAGYGYQALLGGR